MISIYEQLIDLMGKPKNSHQFDSLVNRLAAPTKISEMKTYTSYVFYDFGISITYDSKRDLFCALALHYKTRSVLDGTINPFREPVHAGILPEDKRDDVERKMGRPPDSVSEFDAKMKDACPPHARTDPTCAKEECYYWEKYQLPQLQFTFIFDSLSGPLGLIGIRLFDSAFKVS